MSVRFGGTEERALLAGLLAGLVLSWGLAGCGDNGAGIGNNNNNDNIDGGLLDGSLPDSRPLDGSLPDGAAPDASVVDVDQDQDGFPVSQDCDDSDPDIRPGVIASCDSDCDDGFRVCLATAAWSECSALTECDCTGAGDQRVVDCGQCGTATVTCAWHYAEFDVRTGAVVTAPATIPLTIYPVRVEGDAIFVSPNGHKYAAS